MSVRSTWQAVRSLNPFGSRKAPSGYSFPDLYEMSRSTLDRLLAQVPEWVDARPQPVCSATGYYLGETDRCTVCGWSGWIHSDDLPFRQAIQDEIRRRTS